MSSPEFNDKTSESDHSDALEKVRQLVDDPEASGETRCATPIPGSIEPFSELEPEDSDVITTIDDGISGVNSRLKAASTTPGALPNDALSEYYFRDAPPVVAPPLPKVELPKVVSPATTETKSKFIAEINAANVSEGVIPHSWQYCLLNYGRQFDRPNKEFISKAESELGLKIKCYPKYGYMILTKDSPIPMRKNEKALLLKIIERNIKASNSKFFARFYGPSEDSIEIE